MPSLVSIVNERWISKAWAAFRAYLDKFNSQALQRS
jgi:hypothetical protein